MLYGNNAEFVYAQRSGTQVTRGFQTLSYKYKLSMLLHRRQAKNISLKRP